MSPLLIKNYCAHETFIKELAKEIYKKVDPDKFEDWDEVERFAYDCLRAAEVFYYAQENYKLEEK